MSTRTIKIVDAATFKSTSAEDRHTLGIAKAHSTAPVLLTKEALGSTSGGLLRSSLEEWATDSETPEDIQKAIESVLKAPDQSRAALFGVSDDGRDRDRDRVGQDLDKKNFRKNPVIPWGHDYSLPPIGRALTVFREKGADGLNRTKMLKQFSQENPFGDLVWRMVGEGMVRACSIGFIPTEYKPDVPQKGEAEDASVGFYFAKAELLESSIVTIPSNPRALEGAKSLTTMHKGLLRTVYEQSLDGEFWMPGVERSEVEEAHKALVGERIIMTVGDFGKKSPETDDSEASAQSVGVDSNCGTEITTRSDGAHVKLDIGKTADVDDLRAVRDYLTSRITTIDSAQEAPAETQSKSPTGEHDEGIDPDEVRASLRELLRA